MLPKPLRGLSHGTRHALSRGQRWDDRYTKMAAVQGLRSRAAFKLLQIHERSKLFQARSVVVDLGASPGGWTVAALRTVRTDPATCWDAAVEQTRCTADTRDQAGRYGALFAVDLAQMQPVVGASFLQADLTREHTLEVLSQLVGRFGGADAVLSDAAPNTCGDSTVDHFRSIELAACAMHIAQHLLKPGQGVFLTKLFNGSEVPEYRRQLERSFAEVRSYKPDASRRFSKETYLCARRLRPDVAACASARPE
mmetsp:Transcript_6970/g.21208  ORF Transcript_6970/g.21208 Transcript_6970/m.21208 type:complete len:253 (-) Transcript_6970:1548-2306(-)